MRPRAATKGFQSIAESSVSPPRETEGGFFVSTRRAFIVGVGSALTLPIVSKFEWFIETEGRPLIEVPRHPVETLFVGLYSEGQITLGPEIYGPPTITWREYLTQYVAGGELPRRRSELREICNEYGIEPDGLDSECDPEFWIENWARTESPNANAYHLLDNLDLGPELCGGPGEIGALDFIDGDAPGSDYLGVHVYDDLSISLLQHRLNVLEQNIAVEVAK